MKMSDVRKVAKESGFEGDDDLMETLEFFHEQALVIHFNEDNSRTAYSYNLRSLWTRFGRY